MVIHYQSVSPKNTDASSTEQAEHVVVMNYLHTFVTIIIQEKEAVNLRRSGFERSWREKREGGGVIIFCLNKKLKIHSTVFVLI